MADGGDERLKEEVQLAQLKLQQGLKEEMFECLFKAWSYSPVSTLSLCLFCQVELFFFNNIRTFPDRKEKRKFLCPPSHSVYACVDIFCSCICGAMYILIYNISEASLSLAQYTCVDIYIYILYSCI